MLGLGMSYQDPKISIDRGVECSAEYTCTKSKDKSKVQIVKEESHDLTYKVTVTYYGIMDSRPHWTIHINDKLPTIDNGNLCYDGSKVFLFKPVGKQTIEIQETDEQDTSSLWIDLSEKRYEVYRTLPIVSEKIQTLINKGEIFKPADDKEVKKIFYSQEAGVFLYARNKDWHSDIYYANEKAEEFSKCESKMISQCRCPAGDSSWEVKLPTEIAPRLLEFPKGDAEEGHGNNVLWDKMRLKSISLRTTDCKLKNSGENTVETNSLIDNDPIYDQLPELEYDDDSQDS